jgi:hypothetical protein
MAPLMHRHLAVVKEEEEALMRDIVDSSHDDNTYIHYLISPSI